MIISRMSKLKLRAAKPFSGFSLQEARAGVQSQLWPGWSKCPPVGQVRQALAPAHLHTTAVCLCPVLAAPTSGPAGGAHRPGPARSNSRAPTALCRRHIARGRARHKYILCMPVGESSLPRGGPGQDRESELAEGRGSLRTRSPSSREQTLVRGIAVPSLIQVSSEHSG